MAYHSYRSRRSVKRLSSKSKKNFFITLFIVGLLLYSTINWVLPFFINSLGVVKNTIQPPKKAVIQASENSTLAPPVLNIPYEATSSAKIDIKGYGTPDSKVKLYLDENDIQTVDVSDDGSFIFANIELNLGTNNIYGKTVDEEDKESLPSKTIKLIYDNEKPSLVIFEPEDGKTIQGGDKKVKISGKTDPGSHIFINGTQAIVDSEGKFNTELPLNDGDNIIVIKSQDEAANSVEIERKAIYTP